VDSSDSEEKNIEKEISSEDEFLVAVKPEK